MILTYEWTVIYIRIHNSVHARATFVIKETEKYKFGIVWVKNAIAT